MAQQDGAKTSESHFFTLAALTWAYKGVISSFKTIFSDSWLFTPPPPPPPPTSSSNVHGHTRIGVDGSRHPARADKVLTSSMTRGRKLHNLPQTHPQSSFWQHNMALQRNAGTIGRLYASQSCDGLVCKIMVGKLWTDTLTELRDNHPQCPLGCESTTTIGKVATWLL